LASLGINEPYRATGQGALTNLAKLYGLPYQDYQSALSIANRFGGQQAGGSSSESGNFFDKLPGNYASGKLLFGGGGLFGGGSERKPGTLLAKDVVKLLKQGMSIDDIANVGRLVLNKPTRGVRLLTQAGLSGDQISSLLRPELAAQKAMDAGYHPGTGEADMSVFTSSPGYQFRRDEGQRDIGNSFAARGGAFGGNALRALTGFNQNLASDDYYSYVNQLNNMAGLGQTATNNAMNAGQNYATGGSQALGNYGDARASGIANQYNMYGQGLSGAANAFGNWWDNRNRPSAPPTSGGSYGRGA
jgi:hypothetical protein